LPYNGSDSQAEYELLKRDRRRPYMDLNGGLGRQTLNGGRDTNPKL
jgi:hypothetical protein